MPNGRCNLYVCASPKTGADTEIYPELTKEEEAEPRGFEFHNTLGLGRRKGLRPPAPPVGSRLSRVRYREEVRHHALRAPTSFLTGSGAGLVLRWLSGAGWD